MFIHHAFTTPVRLKKSQTIHYQSQLQQQSPSQLKNNQIINQLYEKFNTLNNTIEIDTSANNFNLIQYEKQTNQKIKYDPQIVNATLRRLENRAQINRIQMELDNRRKHKKTHFKLYSPQEQEYQKKTYKKIHEEFLNNKQSIDIRVYSEQSEDDDEKNTQNKMKHHKGVGRFRQLKKNPKILEYVLNMIKQRQVENQLMAKQKQSRKQKVKQQTANIKKIQDYDDYVTRNKQDKKRHMSLNSHQHNIKSEEFFIKQNNKNQKYNPEIIIEDKFKRIMTMKAKDKLTQEVKNNPRCSKLMEKQNSIIIQLQHEKSNLSKENVKKLKSKFIQLVNELHKGDRKRNNSKVLPSLTSRRNSQNKMVTSTLSTFYNGEIRLPPQSNLNSAKYKYN